MTAISLASIIPFWYYGLLTAKALWISLLLFPVNFCATWLGSRYFSTRGQDNYRNAVLAA